MIVLPFKIPKAKNLGVIYQEDKGKFFFDKLHEHDEIQISRIVTGRGTALVGNAIHEYKEGDIFVIGSNQPHIFKAEAFSERESFMQSLFFTKHSFGKELFDLDDFRELNSFFLNAQSGFVVESGKEELFSHFDLLSKGSDFDRFLIFFNVLGLLAKVKIKKLSSFIYNKEYSDNEGERMRNIIDFTLENYHKKIDLVDIAVKETQALVLAPTRELCMQISKELKLFADIEIVDPSVGEESIDALTTLLNAAKTVVADKKPARNEPCLCGSGKKYKKCCG